MKPDPFGTTITAMAIPINGMKIPAPGVLVSVTRYAAFNRYFSPCESPHVRVGCRSPGGEDYISDRIIISSGIP